MNALTKAENMKVDSRVSVRVGGMGGYPSINFEQLVLSTHSEIWGFFIKKEKGKRLKYYPANFPVKFLTET